MGYDTESVNDLVIDGGNNETVVLDVVNEVVDTVVQKQVNELADSGIPLDIVHLMTCLVHDLVPKS